VSGAKSSAACAMEKSAALFPRALSNLALMWVRSTPSSWPDIPEPSPPLGSAPAASAAAVEAPARCWWRLRRRLDQFIVRHPDYFFGNTPEHAYIQPDNLEILVNHLKCAAFELPIALGDNSAMSIFPIFARALRKLVSFIWREKLSLDAGSLSADTISLRSVTSDNFVIIDVTGAPQSSAKWIFPSALVFLHEKPFTFTAAATSRRTLDFTERKAYVKRRGRGLLHRWPSLHASPRPRNRRNTLSRTHSHSHGMFWCARRCWLQRNQILTNENIGDGKLDLPENEMHTTSYWITLERSLLESLPSP